MIDLANNTSRALAQREILRRRLDGMRNSDAAQFLGAGDDSPQPDQQLSWAEVAILCSLGLTTFLAAIAGIFAMLNIAGIFK